MNMKKKHKWILGLAVLVLGYFVVNYVRQEFRMRQIGQENAQLQQELDELKLQQAALEGDLENASSDAYIERVAREELGFVKEGEIKFIEAEDE